MHLPPHQRQKTVRQPAFWVGLHIACRKHVFFGPLQETSFTRGAKRSAINADAAMNAVCVFSFALYFSTRLVSHVFTQRSDRGFKLVVIKCVFRVEPQPPGLQPTLLFLFRERHLTPPVLP